MDATLMLLLGPAAFAAAALATPNPDPEARLAELKIELRAPGKPVANYVKYVRTGNLLFLAGEGPAKGDGTFVTGKVGQDLTVEQGYEAARLTGIAMLGTLKEAVGGDLRKVRRIVKVLGLVNCPPDFKDQPKVINGFSDLMVAVFGDQGRHARSAVGATALPAGIAVEVEMIVEVE
jgi:enamine deaminase RidA (YjgF/YER057c/UK114 family)